MMYCNWRKNRHTYRTQQFFPNPFFVIAAMPPLTRADAQGESLCRGESSYFPIERATRFLTSGWSRH